MDRELNKLELTPQRENLLTGEEKLPKKRFCKVGTYLWFLVAVLIFLPCIGISTFSLIKTNHLNKEVDYLKEEIQSLKSSLVSHTVSASINLQLEGEYGDYLDYDYDSSSFKDNDEEEEHNSMKDNLKIPEQLPQPVPLNFLKVGDERKRIKRSDINAMPETIQNISEPNSTNVQKKNMSTEQYIDLKLLENNVSIERVNNRGSSSSSAPAKRSISAVDFPEVKVSDPLKKIPQLNRERLQGGTPNRRSNLPKHGFNQETMDEPVQSQRNKVLPSIHFDGDTSKYVMGTHTNYRGNGHLSHQNQTYVDWKSASWVNSLGMDDYFTYNDGYLQIKETGLYLIYAQIFYVEEHDMNGYRVLKNSETLLQCTVTSHSNHKLRKSNTCYTAGVAHLIDGDQISIRDIALERYSIFEVGKSFFGVVKLGDIKNKE